MFLQQFLVCKHLSGLHHSSEQLTPGQESSTNVLPSATVGFWQRELTGAHKMLPEMSSLGLCV